MVLAYHVIFSAYGFWLPNDPRGSGSAIVASSKLRTFGNATKTNTRRSVAAHTHNKAARLAAKAALKFSPVRFTGQQALAISKGFDLARREGQYVFHACAIMPDHVHLVIARHDRAIRRIVGHLKTRARQRLVEEKLWPNAPRPVWGEQGWNVFLFTEQDVRQRIRYVEENPLKAGLKRQKWSFVTPWPSAPGKPGG